MTGGLDVSVDPVFLLDKSSPNLENIYLDKSLVKKQLGWRNFSANSVTGTVLLIDSFPMASGTTHALFVTDKKAYRYNQSNDAFIDLTVGSNFTGNETDGFCGCPAFTAAGNDVYLLTNGLDPIKAWTGSGNFANQTGWTSYPAKQVIYWKNRLIAGGVTDAGTFNPWRIKWSIAGNIANITGTGSGEVNLVDTTDWITALTIMKDKLFVIKERSIWELEYVGGTTVFTPSIKVEHVGSFAGSSVVVLDEEMIFYGSDNIYLFDGFSLNSIGDQIFPQLYEAKDRIINASQAGKFVAEYIEELKTYMISMVHKDKNIPDVIFRYNFDNNAWTKETKEITAIGYFDIVTYAAWSDLTDIWSALTWTWKDRDLPPGAPTTLVGDSTGHIYEDDRLTTSTEYMCYETKDFIFGHAVRWVEVRLIAKLGAFRISYSTDSGTTWSNPKEFALASNWTEYTHYLNLTSQSIRFKVESEASELEIKWIEPWYLPRARSKTLVTA